eukprot:754418-Hanusia_phi.AAC.4
MECFLTGWYTDRQLGTSWQPRTSWRDVVGDHMALTCNAGLGTKSPYDDDDDDDDGDDDGNDDGNGDDDDDNDDDDDDDDRKMTMTKTMMME